MPSGGDHEPLRKQPDGGWRAPESPFPTDDYLVMFNRGMDRHGDAFLAYVVLDGVEQRSLDLVEDFEAAFVGYWPDRQAFLASLLEAQGWAARLEQVCADLGVPDNALQWNSDIVWDYACEQYRITERLGGVYAFAW